MAPLRTPGRQQGMRVPAQLLRPATARDPTSAPPCDSMLRSPWRARASVLLLSLLRAARYSSSCIPPPLPRTLDRRCVRAHAPWCAGGGAPSLAGRWKPPRQARQQRLSRAIAPCESGSQARWDMRTLPDSPSLTTCASRPKDLLEQLRTARLAAGLSEAPATRSIPGGGPKRSWSVHRAAPSSLSAVPKTAVRDVRGALLGLTDLTGASRDGDNTPIAALPRVPPPTPRSTPLNARQTPASAWQQRRRVGTPTNHQAHQPAPTDFTLVRLGCRFVRLDCRFVVEARPRSRTARPPIGGPA